MGKPNDLVQGTLDLLILKTLSLEQQAWIKAKWAESETGRQARFLCSSRPALDPSVFAAVAAILRAVAALACMMPAWRASRLNPMQALRTE